MRYIAEILEDYGCPADLSDVPPERFKAFMDWCIRFYEIDDPSELREFCLHLQRNLDAPPPVWREWQTQIVDHVVGCGSIPQIFHYMRNYLIDGDDGFYTLSPAHE